jgi:DNA polymerase III subunit gamma/tau
MNHVLTKPESNRTASAAVIKNMNVSGWQSKFSRFVEETTYRPTHLTARSTEKDLVEAPPPVSIVISEIVLKEKWAGFVPYLEAKGKSVLVSNLQMCELENIAVGIVRLTCVKKFSFEVLTEEQASLSQEAELYFGSKIAIEISLDKTGAMQIQKDERSTFEIFKELSEQNELIRYLIEHFGAEPNY